jgi:hypothetical protein
MLMVGVLGENQTARQEVLINELEEDLEAALSKLQSKEKELEVWKDKVRRLTGGSLVPASGISPIPHIFDYRSQL